MAAPLWEFSIDVGGTFTDCLAKAPDGSTCRHKLLSSGVTKGRTGPGTSREVIVDRARSGNPDGFWIGWQLSILDETGCAIETATVTGCDSAAGYLYLSGLSRRPAPHTIYELRCNSSAPIVAIRYLLRIRLNMPVPPVLLRLGTTRGTNALITRRGALTALVTTRGFSDVLEIGYQARPRLFELTIRKSPQLAAAVSEINERVTHDGRVLIAPNEVSVRQQLQSLHDAGIESLAICLLHADRHPQHEQQVAELAREVGFLEISCSHDVARLPKFVARADTTVVDAYLNPVLRDYVERLCAELPGSEIRLLTSAGGLVSAEHFCGKDSVLSGPAGGVVGFSRVAQAAGFDRAIGFDMGGTSTDVSRFDGRFELEYETQKAGIRLVAPTMAIETVAAGGGSICRFDGVKLVVGPESAGADPGPACYGRGGPLTLTDVNFYLGRIVAERFPFPLDRAAAERRLEQLAVEVASSKRGGNSLNELCEGLLRIANANMAAAIRRVTIAKGADPADYVLTAFGGAAPQHACAVARELGIKQVLNHPEGGVLSALGIGLADVVRHRSCGIEKPLEDRSLGIARQQMERLQREAAAEVRNEGVAEDRIEARRSLDIRYLGVDGYLTISWPMNEDFAGAFAAAHRQRYGYTHGDRPLEIAAARVEVIGRVADALPRSTRQPSRTPNQHKTVPVYFSGEHCHVPLLERADLFPGDYVRGPAIVTEDIATTVIDPGWEAEVLSGRELLLTDKSDFGLPATAGELIADCGLGIGIRNPQSEIRNSPDPVLLEVFNNRLSSIAEQMGVTLRNTAGSVNVKERLDFSCAVFTADGRLVANAPHVPVHLGAMEETVRSVIAANPELGPGDVIATNDPYAGGSHLPDVTIITPVHNSAGTLLFFTANRAHHAEIGGAVPGSMPPFSQNLAEEGVLIQNFELVSASEARFDMLRDLLLSGPYPTRDVEANLADTAAQIAANRQGSHELLALVDEWSWPEVQAYLEHVQDAAEKKVRLALTKLPTGSHTFTDFIDTATGANVPITATITNHGADQTPAATIDFTGTGPAVDGNLNANRAITSAAVIYTLRVLVNEDIPLNHGVMRPIKIVLPACLLNPQAGATPETTPAVAGGSVETSQRVVDVLLGALGLAGASQGTMNNLIFGDRSFGYYETICGGSGATADCDGASAVQVHMTNTRLTDPEVLERRYPVRVLEFSIRRGSGGTGKFEGGNGVVRRLEFRRSLELSLLTQRRGRHPPYGAAGGGPGALGRNMLIRADGTTKELPGIVHVPVEAGDVLVIETPGGGGFGIAE